MPISSHEHRKLTAFQSVHDQSVYVSMCPWHPPVVSVHNQTPEYLKRLFKPFTTDYGLRDNENKFGLREPCIQFLKFRFYYSGAHFWNILPSDVRLDSTRSYVNLKNEFNRLMSSSYFRTENTSSRFFVLFRSCNINNVYIVFK